MENSRDHEVVQIKNAGVATTPAFKKPVRKNDCLNSMGFHKPTQWWIAARHRILDDTYPSVAH